jgi:hypothetical protein
VQYRYTGPGPDVEPSSGTLIHPGDVWEFPEEPAFGRWEAPGETEGSETPSEATESTPPLQPPADGAGNAATATPDASSTKED